MREPLIDAGRVEAILKDCLYDNIEIPDEALLTEAFLPPEHVKVEGVVHHYVFNPVKLGEHKEEIAEFLKNLPINFRPAAAGGGGGWSFLEAAADKDGNMWGEHFNIEQLLCLGIGAGLAQWLMPREYWSALPGGMPYVAVLV